MHIVHQFAPPFSGLIAAMPGVTRADHMPLESRWDLPADVDVCVVLHGEKDGRDVSHVARPAGWPGKVQLVQIASAGVDDYPEWIWEAPRVASAAGTTAIPIAEFAMALMLAHAKRLATETMGPDTPWPARDDYVGNALGTLHGKTLALLGLGNIAEQVARFAKAFGMDIIATRASDKPTPEPAIRLVDLETLVKSADHLVIAAPISDATRHLLNATRLKAMKSDAHIVNIARGGIIDQEALLAELDAGRLWASLDVTDPEPLPAGHPLLGHARVRITPHISWSSPDTPRRIVERIATNIGRLQAGQPLLGQLK